MSEAYTYISVIMVIWSWMKKYLWETMMYDWNSFLRDDYELHEILLDVFEVWK